MGDADALEHLADVHLLQRAGLVTLAFTKVTGATGVDLSAAEVCMAESIATSRSRE